MVETSSRRLVRVPYQAKFKSDFVTLQREHHVQANGGVLVVICDQQSMPPSRERSCCSSPFPLSFDCCRSATISGSRTTIASCSQPRTMGPDFPAVHLDEFLRQWQHDIASNAINESTDLEGSSSSTNLSTARRQAPSLPPWVRFSTLVSTSRKDRRRSVRKSNPVRNRKLQSLTMAATEAFCRRCAKLHT